MKCPDFFFYLSPLSGHSDRVTRSRFIEVIGGCLPGSHGPKDPHSLSGKETSLLTKPASNCRHKRKVVANKAIGNASHGFVALAADWPGNPVVF